MKCPKCGSEEKTEILYGIPSFENDSAIPEEIRKGFFRGEIILGGCAEFLTSPKYKCRGCGFKYGSQPYIINNRSHSSIDASNYLDCRRSVVFFSFSAGSFFTGYQKITIEKRSCDIILTAGSSKFIDGKKITKELSSAEWNGLLDKIFSEYLLHEWDKKYSNDDLLDGYDWEILVRLETGKEVWWNGYMSYPAYWNEFKGYINVMIAFSGLQF